MRFVHHIAIHSLALLSLAPAAQAQAQGCQPIAPGKTISQCTNYAPAAGGTNGSCGKSASGFDACKFFLEDHLAGKAPVVMGAVAQKGGSSELFGGVYQAVAIQQTLGTSQCIKVFAGDRYGKGSNNKSKMDIVTREKQSKTTSKVNLAKGPLLPLGRVTGLKVPQRKISLDVQAMAPIDLKEGQEQSQ